LEAAVILFVGMKIAVFQQYRFFRDHWLVKMTKLSMKEFSSFHSVFLAFAGSRES